MRTRTVIALLVALMAVVAVPSAAIAQSAGQDQYSDPLQNDGSGNSNSNSGSNGNSGSSGNSQATPAQNTPQSSTPAATSPSTQTSAAQSNKTLPHTGFPVAFSILSGAALLASGIALRRRVVS